MSIPKTIEPTNQDFRSKLDKIVFRCFAQGQYWGTEQDGKLNPDYKPDEPIDRIEAIDAIIALIAEGVPKKKYFEPMGGPVSHGRSEAYNQAIDDIRTNLRIKGE